MSISYFTHRYLIPLCIVLIFVGFVVGSAAFALALRAAVQQEGQLRQYTSR